MQVGFLYLWINSIVVVIVAALLLGGFLGFGRRRDFFLLFLTPIVVIVVLCQGLLVHLEGNHQRCDVGELFEKVSARFGVLGVVCGGMLLFALFVPVDNPVVYW